MELVVKGMNRLKKKKEVRGISGQIYLLTAEFLTCFNILLYFIGYHGGGGGGMGRD